MRLKTLSYFKSKVIEPFSKLLSIFKIRNKNQNPSISSRTPIFRIPRRRKTKVVRFKKPFSIRAFSFPHCRPKTKFHLSKNRPLLSSKFKRTFWHKKRSQPSKKPIKKVRIAKLMTDLFSLRRDRDLDTESYDQIMGDDVRSASPSERGNDRDPFPSPITPGYVIRNSDDSNKESSDDLEEVEDACKSFENTLLEIIVDEGKVKDLIDVEELLYCWRNLKSPVFVDLVCRFYGDLCKDIFTRVEGNGSTHETKFLE